MPVEATIIEIHEETPTVKIQGNLEISRSRTKIKNTEVWYWAEKEGSKKVRVWVRPKSAKEPEELGVFKDMNTAKKYVEQFVD